MSEDKVPDHVRRLKEIQASIRGLWDELSKLSDWIWKVEQSEKDITERVATLEENHTRLRREFDRSDAKPNRSKATWFKPKP